MYKEGDKVKLKFALYGYDAGAEFTIESNEEYLGGRATVSVSYANMYPHLFLKVNKPKNFFSIKQGQIEAAARFVVANNRYMNHYSVDSMSAKIKNYIKEMIDKINSGKESYYCATAGFIITIGLEDDNYYVVEVLVSPDVSVDEEFVNVEEII